MELSKKIILAFFGTAFCLAVFFLSGSFWPAEPNHPSGMPDKSIADEPSRTLPRIVSWGDILNSTGADNQSARLESMRVTFNDMSHNNDTTYTLNFWANSPEGAVTGYSVMGLLNRSTRDSQTSWLIRDPNPSGRESIAGEIRAHMPHPAGILDDIRLMNFSAIGYPEEKIFNLDISTNDPSGFKDENFALFFFDKGTFVPLSEIRLSGSGRGSVITLSELTTYEPSRTIMGGRGAAIIVSRSMIGPPDSIVFLNGTKFFEPIP